jgi:glutamine amidotransferase
MNMIAIIKYNAGNVESVKNAINNLGYDCLITDNESDILAADKVIFPGVGEASSAMKYLTEKGLDNIILNVQKPFLGICLGMQLMCDFSEEGNTKGLGIFNTQVKKFPPTDIVPHMGWNNFMNTKSELFKGIKNVDDVYFVHSYYAEPNQYSIANCNYILPFSAAMQNGNYYGTQFHPEKSSVIGELILKNFLELCE